MLSVFSDGRLVPPSAPEGKPSSPESASALLSRGRSLAASRLRMGDAALMMALGLASRRLAEAAAVASQKSTSAAVGGDEARLSTGVRGGERPGLDGECAVAAEADAAVERPSSALPDLVGAPIAPHRLGMLLGVNFLALAKVGEKSARLTDDPPLKEQASEELTTGVLKEDARSEAGVVLERHVTAVAFRASDCASPNFAAKLEGVEKSPALGRCGGGVCATSSSRGLFPICRCAASNRLASAVKVAIAHCLSSCGKTTMLDVVKLLMRLASAIVSRRASHLSRIV